jgi:hypothetical protein
MAGVIVVSIGDAPSVNEDYLMGKKILDTLIPRLRRRRWGGTQAWVSALPGDRIKDRLSGVQCGLCRWCPRTKAFLDQF